MKLFCPISIIFTGLVLTCLSGCHEKSAALTPPNKTVAQTKEAKPGAAVKLISDSIISINANELTQLQLLLDVKEASGTLLIELSPTNGLEVLETQLIQSINLAPSTPIQIPVKLRAIADGRYYLNIHASIDNGDSVSTRNLALIVQVGAETEKSTQLKKASGDKVISLPAQETISNQ